MKLVVYLSGETGRTIQWHRERDSVADSIAYKGKKLERLKYLLASSGCFWDKDGNEVELPAKFTGKMEPLYCSPDALLDLASDIKENDELDAEISADLERLAQCECICNDIYVIGGVA